MEQEYVKTLLDDLGKSYSSDEKIHLLTVFVTELAKSDKENKKVISELKDTLLLTTEAIKALTKNIELANKKFEDIENHMTTLAKFSVDTAEGAADSAKHILKIYSHFNEAEESVDKRCNLLFDLIKKVGNK